ncbi:MAG: acyl-CoA dehydrogenase family protein [Polyangiaceae bacterium]|jgi:alkylation response protein AidB-like acyl-CoA dehydrogenase
MAAPCVANPQPVGEELVDLLLPSVRRFMATEVDGSAIDEASRIPGSVREGFARLGLFGMTVPEEFGGAGFSLWDACRVIAEIARVDRSVGIMLGLHAGLGSRGLVEWGTPELQAHWLPRIAAGECITAFGATEAGAGSDLMAIRTTGRLVDDNALRIDGEKSYVTNGGFANLFTVLVRTPGLGGDRGHTLVAIPAGTPGISLGKEEHKLGIRGSSTVTVAFEDVIVPMTHVLGRAGEGMELAYKLLAWGRTLMSAGCAGAAQGALDATVRYVGERKQFGQAIGNFTATRAHVAWMAARAFAMRALIHETAESQARGSSIEVASAVAKVFCSEGAFEAFDRAIQLHGAVGFLESTGVARGLRDCRITRIFEGANDVLLLRIGAATLGVRRELNLSCIPALRDMSERVVAFDELLHREMSELRKRLGVMAVRRQLVLQRVARAEICVRAAAAALSRAADSDKEIGLARYAATSLIDEGAHWLAQLEDAERDEASASKLTAMIYGS